MDHGDRPAGRNRAKPTSLARADDGETHRRRPVKEISPLELVARFAARAAAGAGVLALLLWVGWVMLDVKNLQSGFTLP